MQTVNATRSERANQPILVATLKADIDMMRFAGFWPSYVECGPLVYEMLIEWVINDNRVRTSGDYEERIQLAREERMRKELMLGLTDMTFNGMPVRLSHEVPDGRMWPSKERGGHVARPFIGTEAHDASNPNHA